MDGGMHTTEPVVDNGMFYLAVSTAHTPSASNGYVAAYDVAEQTTVWKRKNIARPGTPTIGNGTIYFATFGSEDANGTGFFALDSSNGETKWHKSASAGISDSLFTDGRLYVNMSAGAAHLDPSTGDVIWSTEGINSSACYADGKLFYAEGIALSADDGSVLWDVSTDEDQLQSATNGLVYSVKTGNAGPAVMARSVDDGSVEWSHSLSVDDSFWNATLAVANGHVFFRAGNSVRALDAKTGTEAWVHEVDAELTNAPAVGNNTLYIAGRTTLDQDDGDAVVTAIDTASGDRQWDYSFGSWNFDEYGPAAKTPVIADGRVYTTTYPMGSTLDWMYTEYADFHILGSSSKPTTTDGKTTETTTNTTSETSTVNATTSKSAPGQSTTQKTTSSTEMSKTTTTKSTTGTTGTATMTASNGQPGFGVLTTIGGLAGLGAYLRSRVERKE
ncbi:outer membrane protein assembly factor BamB family protein [Haladaptatus salinisoli]|uniref:outer membrane protein assembly factor BamB family protein n=1 Tax=Haladaptatus salinisoli TaxID=2884876 RepID=UPI001D0A9AF4|nr:PQQ-binding-like beta-propeller repeat protein [Haladaptatus salinisoli]